MKTTQGAAPNYPSALSENRTLDPWSDMQLVYHSATLTDRNSVLELNSYPDSLCKLQHYNHVVSNQLTWWDRLHIELREGESQNSALQFILFVVLKNWHLFDSMVNFIFLGHPITYTFLSHVTAEFQCCKELYS